MAVLKIQQFSGWCKMDLKKWYKEHEKEIREIAISVVGLAASIIIAAILPDHDNAND